MAEEQKLVLWDMGEVWIHVKFNKLIRDVANFLNESEYAIHSFLFVETPMGVPWLEYVESVPDHNVLWRQLLYRFGLLPHMKPYKDFMPEVNGASGSIMPIMGEEKKELAKTAATLDASGVLQGILSNANPLHADLMEEFLNEELDVLGRYVPLERRFYSCNIRVRKGDDGMAFYHACTASGVTPMNACLVDDRPENVRGARRFKGKSILHISPSHTQAQLTKLGFLPS